MNLMQLTKAEEQVMHFVWKRNETVVKDVVEQFDEPKPAYTTVATVLSVLEKKGFVNRRKIGNTNLFSPAVSKKDYTKFQFTSLLKNYFNGSFPKMATFFAKENNLSIDELEEMLKITESELDKPDNKL
ncbi:BlaI/MecI/CopY family transcriptional regulator [uncultured Sunxiuqinia sp.]|jgi:BlaI family transcriptional regulator, penicillinase repressor|uniref:BlaI/MecI/CopY family transcriptional regulator n=1 Tax=uncultured Sunxiuqinia sp. TaxID=1573825 RepID=UPI0030DC68E4|tara:strand:- start:7378 stop:7764 length:387 start_codon:yes stop_codon:yes gene_type:complete